MRTLLCFALLSFLVHPSTADQDQCEELNARAIALRNGDSCKLFNSIINNGDILAGNRNEVGLTCGVHLENVDHENCVEEVVDAVAGIIDQGCEVTGGG